MNTLLYGIIGAVAVIIAGLLASNKNKSRKIDNLKREASNAKIQNAVKTAEKTAQNVVAGQTISTLQRQKENAQNAVKLGSAVKPNMTEAEAIALAREQVKIHTERGTR